MKKLEYFSFDVPTSVRWIDWANRLGKDGWELVQVANNEFTVLIMKREIPDPQPVSETNQTPLVATDGYEPENDGYEKRTAKSPRRKHADPRGDKLCDL